MSRIAAIDHVPVEAEKRRAFREADIMTRFRGQHGHCALCPALIQFAGGPPSVLGAVNFQADHILPRELDGKTSLPNLQLLCAPCHAIKTAQDIKRIAKSRRLRAKNADPETRALAKPYKRKIANRGFPKKVRERS